MSVVHDVPAERRGRHVVLREESFDFVEEDFSKWLHAATLVVYNPFVNGQWVRTHVTVHKCWGMVAGMARLNRDLFLSRMQELGHNMKSLSKAAGLGETAARDLLKRSENPTQRTLTAFAGALGLTVPELTNDTDRTARIPIVGYVSAGEGWSPVDDESHDVIELSVEGDAIALHVRGDSMIPVYRDGDLLIGIKRSQRRAENVIGLDCIVETTDHRRFVKFLARGSEKGLFCLRSYNPSAGHKDIEDVTLLWAAPIVWVRRGGR